MALFYLNFEHYNLFRHFEKTTTGEKLNGKRFTVVVVVVDVDVKALCADDNI